MIEITRLRTQNPNMFLLIRQSEISKDYFIGIEDHNIFETVEICRDFRQAHQLLNIISQNYTDPS